MGTGEGREIGERFRRVSFKGELMPALGVICKQ